MGLVSGQKESKSKIKFSQQTYFLVYVTVLGYPPLPAWPLSDGCQARQGLDTDVTPFHNWLNVLQMVAPGAAIWLHLARGVGTYTGAMHARPTKIFYKSGAHHASGLTFS